MKKQKEKNAMYMEDVPNNTKATVRRLFKLLGQQKGKLIAVIIFAVLSCAAYASIPMIVGIAIDNLLDALRSGAPTEQLPALVTEALTQPISYVILASVFCAVVTYMQQFIVASVGENLTLTMRKQISDKLNRLPLRYFDSHKVGEVMSRVTNDLEKVSQVMQVGFMQFISSILIIAFTSIAMLSLNPMLFLITIVSFILCGVATIFVARWSQRCAAKNLQAMSNLNAKVEEVFTGNRVVKVFSKQKKVIEDITHLNKEQFESNRKSQFADYTIYPSIRVLNQLGFVAVAVIGGITALSGGMTLGAVQAYLQYYNQVAEPVTQLSYVITSLQAAIAGAERVFELLDEEEEISDKNAMPAVIEHGNVTFNNIRFGYTPEKTLIHDLSLEVKPNEMVAIVGPTGGGKTTLINLLMRFYELNDGKILIDGGDISKMSRAYLRSNIGMVLQDTWLFEGTVAQNIAYGKMDATREEIESAAKSARCDHFIHTLPDGYDTVISGEATVLSQGQMQLLTIARAMLTNPSILILDEATSSVDTRTEVEIQKAMTKLMENKTSFVIAHRLSTIRNADIILVVKDGDIVERGNHEALLAQNGFYASLYNSQFNAAS